MDNATDISVETTDNEVAYGLVIEVLKEQMSTGNSALSVTQEIRECYILRTEGGSGSAWTHLKEVLS